VTAPIKHAVQLGVAPHLVKQKVSIKGWGNFIYFFKSHGNVLSNGHLTAVVVYKARGKFKLIGRGQSLDIKDFWHVVQIGRKVLISQKDSTMSLFNHQSAGGGSW